MKTKGIRIRQDATVVEINRKHLSEYYVKTKVRPGLFISYKGLNAKPKIDGRELFVGQMVEKGQLITE